MLLQMLAFKYKHREVGWVILHKEEWKSIFNSGCAVLIDQAEMLSKIDAEIGDGDHGVTIKRIAETIKSAVDKWHDDSTLKNFLENLAGQVMGVAGGSASPLWGSFLEGMAQALEDQQEIDEELFKNLFAKGLEAMYEITPARLGDKTMMDALIPAVETIKTSEIDIKGMLQAAAKAAQEGADKTAHYQAKYGRAKNLKERSIGHKDPGAVSMALFFTGLSQGINKL